MKANELELLSQAGEDTCMLVDSGTKTGRIPFSRAALALRPGVNLLRNWYFGNLINQRRITEYLASSGKTYAIDGWYLQNIGDKLTISNGYVELKNETGSFAHFIQIIDLNIVDVQVTASVMLADGSLYSTTATATAVWGEKSAKKIPGGYLVIYRYDVGLGVFIRVDDGSSVKISAVKLELGPAQTLAHQDASRKWTLNDPPPDPALELLKCQRSFLRLPGNSGAYTIIGHGKATSASQLDLQIPLPVAMRTTPSVRMTGTWVAAGAGMSEVFSAEDMTVTMSSIGAVEAGIIIQGFKNLIPNHVYTVQRKNDGNANIDLSAEW